MTTKEAKEEEEIIVYRFQSNPSVFDPSPFVTKLECVFRMANIKYKVAQGDARNAPKGKLPFIQLRSGEKLGDSTLCYLYLKKHNGAPDIDAALTDRERAEAAVYRAWLEEWLYFLLIWDQWIDNWYLTRETFFGKFIPFWPLRLVIFNFVYRNIASTLYGNGITRHSREEILGMIDEGYRTLSVLVGEKGLFDGKPCAVNAYLGGLMVSIMEEKEISVNSYREISKYPNLKKWTEEWAAKYFPERKIRE